jgi:hypothetical protein
VPGAEHIHFRAIVPKDGNLDHAQIIMKTESVSERSRRAKGRKTAVSGVSWLTFAGLFRSALSQRG